jgi:hypothetical protein
MYFYFEVMLLTNVLFTFLFIIDFHEIIPDPRISDPDPRFITAAKHIAFCQVKSTSSGASISKLSE